MFKTLIVALDLGDDGDHALSAVEALASTAPVTVELVTVSYPGTPTDADSWELERRAARFAGSGATWNVIVDTDVAHALLRHVAERPEALLVMGTSARRPLNATLFGSVVQDVLRNTDRPVLLVGPHVEAGGEPCTSLIACVDASDSATWAVPAIVSWQETFGSRTLRVAEVLPVDARNVAAARHHVDTVTSLLAAQRVEAVAIVVRHDDPVTGLEHLADELTGAIYVAASGRYTDGRPHLHSTTQELVRRATRPVLIVPARPSLPMAATVDGVERCVHQSFHNTIVSPSA